MASRAQKEAEDRALELQEQFEKDADPEEREALEEFSDALDAIKNDWNGFHDDYTGLRKEGAGMDAAAVSARLEELIAQFGGIVEAVDGLPSSDAAESMIEMLQEAAEAERETMFEVNDALVAQDPAGPIAPPLDQMDAIVEESEDVLKEVSRTIKTIVDDDPEENLAEVKDFNGHYKSLLVKWDTFHQRYDDWRKTDGGCDRTEVLQSLDQFNLRIGELGRKVRDLPRSSYLLPMYTLLVEAVEREEGAIRALRNSWRPFTVDAFKAVDQERVNANRLRRQADTGLQGLRGRS